MSSTSEPRWDRPILMGCAPSSGSSKLSNMLNAHPEVLSGPEISLFSHPIFWSGQGTEWATKLHRLLDPMVDELKETTEYQWDGGRGFCPYVKIVYESALDWYGVDVQQVRGALMAGLNPDEAVRTIFAPKLQETGKPYWAEKSPPNIYALPAFLRKYPNGRGVLVVRDGRDVVCSLVKSRKWNFFRAAATWLLEAALCVNLSRDSRVHTVRYEDLVADPRGTLTKLCEFLGIAPEVDRMMNDTVHSDRVGTDPSLKMEGWTSRPNEPLNDRSIGRWKNELTPVQVGILASACVVRNAPGLEECGGATLAGVLQHFNFSTEDLERLNASATDLLNYAQSMEAPSFPPIFPLTYVDFDALSSSRQVLSSMLFWIWGQVDMVNQEKRRLEATIESLKESNRRLEYMLWRKSGKLGALRELTGRNREAG
jgi:hypothetical protein